MGTRQAMEGCIYTGGVSRRLTIRIGDDLYRALKERAREQGWSMSDLARRLLHRGLALEEIPMGVRTGRLRGQLEFALRDTVSWRERLRQRNWRA